MIPEINGRLPAFASGKADRSASHAIPIPCDGWPPRPFEIVSLLDMLKFRLFDLLNSTWRLEVVQKDASKQDSTSLTINETDHKFYQRVINEVRVNCERFELDSTLDQLNRIDETLNAGSIFGAYNTFTSQVQQVWECLKTDLDRRVFMFMPRDQSKDYEQEDLFGKEVTDKFRSTVFDVSEAGNCYATGRYTACVFHCMRVLEKGLHAFVHHLNDIHAAGIVFSKTVEETNWGNIIQEIQISLENPKRLARLVPLPTKNEMARYSTAALEFEHFKQAWRDDVSHSRRSYDGPAAKSVMDHVEAFMRKISLWLSE